VDPIAIIVTALALGAAVSLKPNAEQAVKDGYAALKELIREKYSGVNVDLLESDPSSAIRKAVLEEELAEAGADEDEEMLRQARDLIDAIQTYAPQAAASIGVDLEDIKARWTIGTLDQGSIVRHAAHADWNGVTPPQSALNKIKALVILKSQAPINLKLINLKLSVAHPKLLSKRFSSPFRRRMQ